MTQPTPTILVDETGQVSNFRRNPETGDLYDASGLGDNVRQISSTQATPPAPAGQSAHAYRQPGAGATNDDSGINTPGKNFSEANFAYNNLIRPQPNILDNYASYTYNLSLCMLTPAQISNLFAFGKANTASWSLLMSSGGAGDSKRDQAPNGSPSGRNKYFKNDFYLDNFTIKTALTGATGMTHNFTDMSFSIFEPTGITLLECMGNAYKDLMKNAGYQMGVNMPNLSVAHYCMVLTFYGYDDTGKLTKVGSSGTTPTKTIGNDSQAIVEKYFPFMISDFKFKVGSKGTVEYQIKGGVLAGIPLKTNRGTVKNPAILIGETMGDILSGPKEKASPTSPGERIDNPVVPTASSNAPDPSVARESVAGYSNLF
jgi:hypothetical protein